jgi:hypothetical protein
MDCWHPITVRAEKLDAAQRWAQLEGKSPAMREDLAQRYAPRKPSRQRGLSSAAICCELIVVAVKAWWYIYGN